MPFLTLSLKPEFRISGGRQGCRVDPLAARGLTLVSRGPLSDSTISVSQDGHVPG